MAKTPVKSRRERLLPREALVKPTVSGKGAYEGLTMDRLLQIRSKGKQPAPDPLDVLFDVLIDEGGTVPAIKANTRGRAPGGFCDLKRDVRALCGMLYRILVSRDAQRSAFTLRCASRLTKNATRNSKAL